MYMDEKRAYCCLNCTNLPPCNAAAGNCVPCCKDCGDTSACQSSAYFDGSNFYADYSASVNLSSSQNGEGCEAFWGGPANTYYNLNIFSAKEETWVAVNMSNINGTGDDGGSLVIAGSESCGNPDCKGGGYSFDYEDVGYCDAGYVICKDGQTTVNYTTIRDDCGNHPTCITKNMPGIGAVNGCNTAPDILPYYFSCLGEEECSATSLFCTEDTRITFTESRTINFNTKVKLYNSQGQDVGNIIGATYDPCNATASWSAPGCHFFDQ